MVDLLVLVQGLRRAGRLAVPRVARKGGARGRAPGARPAALKAGARARQNAPLAGFPGGSAPGVQCRGPAPGGHPAEDGSGASFPLRTERVPLSPAPLRFTTAAATDVGLRRPGNEDNHAVWAAADGEDHPAGTLLVVCDGMGGSNAGEVASGMAVQVVVREFSQATGTDAAEALAHAVQVANREIWELSKTRADMSGMG